MHRLKEAIIVEGTYDQIRLSGFLDTVIIKTNGFAIFHDQKRIETIKTLAKKTGIVILTDSDSAGFKIRSFIKQAVTDGEVLNAYIPDIYGKERRKNQPSKEGLLGVEGVGENIIIKALKDAGCELNGEIQPKAASAREIRKADLFVLGLVGGLNSSYKRDILCQSLDIPSKISSGVLISVLNRLMTYEQLCQYVKDIDGHFPVNENEIS